MQWAWKVFKSLKDAPTRQGACLSPCKKTKTNHKTITEQNAEIFTHDAWKNCIALQKYYTCPKTTSEIRSSILHFAPYLPKISSHVFLLSFTGSISCGWTSNRSSFLNFKILWCSYKVITLSPLNTDLQCFSANALQDSFHTSTYSLLLLREKYTWYRYSLLQQGFKADHKSKLKENVDVNREMKQRWAMPRCSYCCFFQPSTYYG